MSQPNDPPGSSPDNPLPFYDDRPVPRPDDGGMLRPDERRPRQPDDEDRGPRRPEHDRLRDFDDENRRPRRPDDDDRRRDFDDDRRLPRREQKSNALMIILIVLGILILLGGGAAALFWPALSKVRSAAARAQSQNNLKQIGIGVHNAASAFNSRLPPSVGAFPNPQGPRGSLYFHLLPHFGQDGIYQMYQRNPSGVADSVTIKIFCAPADSTNPEKGGNALTSYSSNAALFGLTDGGTARMPQSLVKGSMYTVMFVERYGVASGKRHPWYGINDRDNYLYPPGANGSPPDEGDFTPPQFDVDPDKADPNAPHALAGGIINVGMGDASVRSFTLKQMSPHSWAWGCSTFGPLAMEVAPPGW
jgi:hypothetical protein